MFGDGPLSFREFAMGETLPLATVHDAVLEFLRGRDDAVLFGAQAVNAYVDEPRLTQDVDVLSVRAEALAQEIQEHLANKFHIAVRVCDLGPDKGLRVYQLAKPKNRHLVDVRRVSAFPPKKQVENVWVVEPAELIAMKVIALHKRQGKPKAGTDWRDLAMLLLAFPDLKKHEGAVRVRLDAAGADDKVMQSWDDLVSQEIVAEGEDDDLSY